MLVTGVAPCLYRRSSHAIGSLDRVSGIIYSTKHSALISKMAKYTAMAMLINTITRLFTSRACFRESSLLEFRRCCGRRYCLCWRLSRGRHLRCLLNMLLQDRDDYSLGTWIIVLRRIMPVSKRIQDGSQLPWH